MFKKVVSVVVLSSAFVTGMCNVAIPNASAATYHHSHHRSHHHSHSAIPSSATASQGQLGQQGQGDQVVAYAEQFLGVPYTHGGRSPQTGFDCSGFAYYVYKHFGITLSTGPAGQLNQGTQVSTSDMQPGDIVFFRSENSRSGYHEGIYIGNNKFIQAVAPGKPVQITDLNSSWYAQRFLEARRYL